MLVYHGTVLENLVLLGSIVWSHRLVNLVHTVGTGGAYYVHHNNADRHSTQQQHMVL